MAKIQPITDFEIGRKHAQTDFELFQNWTLDLRLAVVDGKPAATGKRAKPLWHNTEREEFDPMAETCKASPNGGMIGPTARMERLAMLQNNYGLGEVYEHDYIPEQLADRLLEAARNHCDEPQADKIVANADWGNELVSSL